MIDITKANLKTHTSSAPGRKIKYIVVHYTASASSKKGSAMSIAKNVFGNASARDASADFIVDDTTIVQYTDIDNRYCWHCGDKLNVSAPYKGICTNKNSIGIELCSNNKTGKATKYADDGNWYFTDATIKNGIDLVKYLMKKYGIPAANVIRHRDVTGKGCPGTNGWFGKDLSEWNAFKKSIIDSSASEVKSDGYIVEVTEKDTNLRDAPSMDGKVVEVLQPGARIRIVGYKGNWLQSNWNRYVHKSCVRTVNG